EIAAEVGRAAPAGRLSKAERRNSSNLHAAPLLARRIPLGGIVVRALAADDGHVVALARQGHCEIAEVLSGGRDVGIERLIEEENFHDALKSSSAVPEVAFSDA